MNDIILKGVKGIDKASMSKELNYLMKVDGEFTRVPQWVIDTNGTNLLDVMGHPDVDFSRTYSNDIHEIIRPTRD